MIKVGIIGAKGYAGRELLRILYRHEGVSIKAVQDIGEPGESLAEIHPELSGLVDLKLETADAMEMARRVDLVFLAVPHGIAMRYVPKLVPQVSVIDLSADYRMNKRTDFERWYSIKHTDPTNLGRAVYGLVELKRGEIKKSRFIANPGCYPTGIILALAPLLQAKAIEADPIIADAASGVSGAGRTLSDVSSFVNANENMKAYRIDNHPHLAEMGQELSLLGGKEVKLSFTPHLIPLERGILSTIYVRPRGISPAKVEKLFRDFYAAEPFVRLRGQVSPELKDVRGTNFCDLGYVMEKRTGWLKLFSALDNLVKGAAGQAVQNMNVMYGMPEAQGLI